MVDNSETNYILITPAKNEEDHLPLVAESVIGQSIPPVLWVILDDGSSDGTWEIIISLVNRFDWIKAVRLPPHPRDITFHYSYVCKKGFNYAIEYCGSKKILYNFIGLLDADTILEERYFSLLLFQFKNNDNMGVASGHIIDLDSNDILWDDKRRNWPNSPLPRGSGRLWRNNCFFETGGYLVEPSPDSISNVKAILRGWEIIEFGHIIALQRRATSSAEGLWNGFLINGRTAYYLNKHPVLVLLSSFYYISKKPYYTGFAFTLGYISAWLRNSEKIQDQEIRDYYWDRRLNEYLSDQYISNFFNKYM